MSDESRLQRRGQHNKERETPNERGSVPDQQSIKNKMAAFHAKMNKCTFNHCITLSFPSLQVSESGQCTRCSCDKYTCKL